MVHRDYTQELGLAPVQKKVSKPVAAIVLLVIAVGCWYVISTLIGKQPRDEQNVDAAPTAHANRS